MGRYVVGISGASGIILGKKVVLALLAAGQQVELIMTPNAYLTAKIELKEEFSLPPHPHLIAHSISDMSASIASGSYLTDGMVIVPCSMATLAAISVGLSDNLLRRAADVTLKEKRAFILVPRETPLSSIHLENMVRLSHAGATLLFPLPGWYTHPRTIEEVEDFIVGKILDALKVDNQLYPRWRGTIVDSNSK